MKIKDVLVMAAIGLLGAACSDDDNKGSQWGDGVGGTKTNLDVSAYDKWTYVNLKPEKRKYIRIQANGFIRMVR